MKKGKIKFFMLQKNIRTCKSKYAEKRGILSYDSRHRHDNTVTENIKI